MKKLMKIGDALTSETSYHVKGFNISKGIVAVIHLMVSFLHSMAIAPMQPVGFWVTGLKMNLLSVMNALNAERESDG